MTISSKQKIIDATIQLVTEKGFANTRTAQIAALAGVSEGLIYKYFPSKSDLFSIIVKDNFHKLKTGLEKELADPDLTATEKLRKLIYYHVDFFTGEKNILQVLWGHSDRKSVDLEPIFEHIFIPYLEIIMAIIKQGMDSREFRPVNPQITAVAVFGSMQITVVSHIFLKNNQAMAKLKAELADFLLAGIKNQAGVAD